MAPSSVCNSFLGLLVFVFLGSLSANTTSPSFSFPGFEQDPAAIALFGGSKLVNGGSAIELPGQAVFEEPIRVVQGNPQRLASFSTNFTFSLSEGNGDGLAFAMAPSGVNSNLSGNGRFGLPLGKVRTLARLLSVEFDASKNTVAIDDSGSLSVRNVSSLNLVLNSDQKLQTWIDYDASSASLEVRLSTVSGSKPADPFLAHSVDLWEMWKDRDVFMGLSSRSSSNRSCLIHSWSFRLRPFPHWMHSEPLDPGAISDKDARPLRVHVEKNDCLLKVLAAMIFGTGSGAVGAFCILYLWTIFGNRRPVVPEELVGKEEPLDRVHEKVGAVDVDKAVEDGR